MTKRKKKNNNIVKLVILLIVLLILGACIFCLLKRDSKPLIPKKETIPAFVSLDEVNSFTKEHDSIKVNISYEYNDEIEKDKVISQSVKDGTNIEEVKEIDIVLSLGKSIVVYFLSSE